jgi:hypothetical protein
LSSSRSWLCPSCLFRFRPSPSFPPCDDDPEEDTEDDRDDDDDDIPSRTACLFSGPRHGAHDLLNHPNANGSKGFGSLVSEKVLSFRRDGPTPRPRHAKPRLALQPKSYAPTLASTARGADANITRVSRLPRVGARSLVTIRPTVYSTTP